MLMLSPVVLMPMLLAVTAVQTYIILLAALIGSTCLTIHMAVPLLLVLMREIMPMSMPVLMLASLPSCLNIHSVPFPVFDECS
jgi:hypothetical protein